MSRVGQPTFLMNYPGLWLMRTSARSPWTICSPKYALPSPRPPSRDTAPLIDSLECHPKDRHVLAAAVRSDAGALVTFNIADFPATSVERFAIDVLHPSECLLDLLDLAPGLVVNELRLQANSNKRRPKTLSDLLETLSRSGAEAFSEEGQRHPGISSLVFGGW